MGEESSTSTELKLPKLVFMVLKELPELKSICNAKLICNSLEVIEADTCEKLKRTAIYLENGQPSTPSLEEITVYLEEWWESVVEWEHPNAKDTLCQSILQRRLWPARSQVASMLKGRTPVPELLSDPGFSAINTKYKAIRNHFWQNPSQTYSMSINGSCSSDKLLIEVPISAVTRLRTS
ncbi:hypothetical protein NC651_039362 [Populus alba x Populus x berolinensis]|nr:hypothetical protein NC651_039362 [Populus alba x Populus x berolinensis]